MRRLFIPKRELRVLEFTRPTAPGMFPKPSAARIGLGRRRIKVTDPIMAFREWFGVFPAKAEV